MVSINDLKDLVLYKKQFFLPINMKNKKKNSLIMLLTPNYKSSISCMNLPYTINRKYFESYYLEKNVFTYINNESLYYPTDDEYLFEVARTNSVDSINKDDITDDDIESDARAYDIKNYDYVSSKINDIVQEADKYKSDITKNTAGIEYEETSSLFYISSDGKLLVGQDSVTGLLTIPTVKIFDINKLEHKTSAFGEKLTGISPKKIRKIYDFQFSSPSTKNPNKTHIEYNHGFVALGGDNVDKKYKPKTSNTCFLHQKFMTPGQIVSSNAELSNPLKYFIARYGSKMINKSSNDYANKKLGGRDNIVFSGYSGDVEVVKKAITMKEVNSAFSKMKLSVPDYPINIIVSSSESDFGYIDNRNIVIFSKSAFGKLRLSLKYEDYITYTLQLYTMYVYNSNVDINIAEPASLVISGLCDKFLKDDDYTTRDQDENLTLEKLYKYILKYHGLDKVKEIIKYNDFNKLNAYYAELLSLYGQAAASNIRINEADEDSGSSDTVSRSRINVNVLGGTKDFGKRLIRRLKSKSAYKLNKIKRDIERGNVGSERSGETTSIEDIKNGNVFQGVGIANGSSSINSGSSSTVDNSVSEQLYYSLSEAKQYLGEDNYLINDDVLYIFEADNYNNIFRKALYQDRFRNNKAVLSAYKKVKEDCQFIKWTYLDLPRYRDANLFFDLSYYNESFFRNISLSMNDEKKINTIRSYNAYAEFLKRLVKDNRFSSYTKKTIFIPVLDWRHNSSTRMWIYKEDINPISYIYNLLKTGNYSELKNIFGDSDIIFLGSLNYFKINFSKLTLSAQNKVKYATMLSNLLKRILKSSITNTADSDDDADNTGSDSPTGIAMELIDKIEKAKNVEINDVSKLEVLPSNTDAKNIIDKDNTVKREVQKKLDTIDKKEDNDKKPAIDISVNRAINGSNSNDTKSKIVDAVAKASSVAISVDHAMDKLDEDEFKQMIDDLGNEPDDGVQIDKTRQAKMTKNQEEFHNSSVGKKSIRELLSVDQNNTKLPETKLNISSIDDGWKSLTFMNFDKKYDPDSDIVKMLDSMKDWSHPITVKNIDVEDASNSEDAIYTWKISCEDYKGTRFTLKIDIPKFIDGNFLRLRGNRKTLMIQSTLVPIIKTGPEECQIIGVGGYNKIFVRKYGNSIGKSIPSANKLLKAVTKYADSTDNKKMIVTYGDSHIICNNYELPVDYVDLSNSVGEIKNKHYIFYFNQDTLRSKYEGIDDSKGLPIGVKLKGSVTEASTSTKSYDIVYYTNDGFTVTDYIAKLLCDSDTEFSEFYTNIVVSGVKYSYAQASILSIKLPLIIVCAYLEGLTTTLKKAGIEYEFVQSIRSDKRKYDPRWDYLTFLDGYMFYKSTYQASMLLNGLKEVDTESYSIRDINKKQTYIDFLDNYGGVIKADGLENSYDCMIDPITKEILETYKLPTDYVSVLIYTSNLLCDNKYVSHIDQSVRRWRRKELIAGYFYKALSIAYQSYANQIRHSRKNTKMTIKQSAVIDLILSRDPSTSDLSINNVVNDIECNHTVTNKGLVGLNTERGYSVDKRGYDDSMLNVLGMDTGFSGNVGINRQATIDANIEGNRGYVKSIKNDTSKFSTAKTLTTTEAMVPLGCTHDDPPRTLMTYVQTSKHTVRCENNDPMLVTNGADEAIPYLSSDIYAFKAKKDGTIVEIVQNEKPSSKGDYMVIEYKDGTHEFISLEDKVEKNSDGGYSVIMKLSTDLEVGKKIKENDVVAYDKLSFSNNVGESKHLACNMGTLAKVAILSTDENFEDSALITEEFGEKIGTTVVMAKEVILDKGSNIFVYKNIGDQVAEGEPIMDFKADFDDDAVNQLMKNLTINQDQISELGRNPIKSKYSGVLCDIQVYRTVELDEMSESLRKFVTSYENQIKKTRAIYKKYGIDSSELPITSKMDNVGKAKNINDGVKIIFYIKYIDKMATGDKIVFFSANKGTIKYLVPKGLEPTTKFRPNEHIDSFAGIRSINKRMTCSIPIMCALNKLMVELDRSVKDLAGISYDDSKV